YQQMQHGVTTVTVAAMIVPLHVRYPPVVEAGNPNTQEGRQESRQTEYPRGNQVPQVKEDYGSMGPKKDPGVPDALPFLAQDRARAKGAGHGKP
ncbi:hypothetical protein Tco_0225653, partial [Tanacetum coccineum]